MDSRQKSCLKALQERRQTHHIGGEINDEPLCVADLEVDTVAKQRRELQLLIGELQDRDKELNDMVAAHQQQLAAWEHDRSKLAEIEVRNQRLEVEVKKRNEQLRLLIQRLKFADTKQKSKDDTLNELQARLKKADIVLCDAQADNHDLLERNNALNSSLTDMNSRIGSLEAKEQEFVTKLQLKEGDLVSAESEISELNSKIRRLEGEIQEFQCNSAAAHVEVEQQKAKFRHCQGELDKTIAEMANKTSDLITLRQDVAELRDENQKLKRELYLSEEQQKRKADLMSLQKSKQDRSDVELGALRQLYERQQKELATLQINLSAAQEMLQKQEERLQNISYGKYDLEALECSSQTTNDLLEEARRSTEEEMIFCMSSSPKNKSPRRSLIRSPSIECAFSPSTKLQRLLAESREMVQNLESQAQISKNYHKKSSDRRNY